MRAAIVLLLTVSIVNMCLSAWIGHHAKPCVQIDCINLYDPVCGKQLRKHQHCEEWEYRIFSNSCYMLRANTCGNGLVTISLTAEIRRPCIRYKCDSTLYDPKCGKKLKNGCWEEIIFQNYCYMLSANSCVKDVFIPCVENECTNKTTPIN